MNKAVVVHVSIDSQTFNLIKIRSINDKSYKKGS